MEKADKRIQFLDGLRGIAIILVIGSHFLHHSLFYMIGKQGVWIFFVLSAYLNTQSFLADNKPFSVKNILRFYIKRINRIYPPYFVALWLLYIVRFSLNQYFDLWGLITFNPRVYYFIYWTIRVELLYYLILPVLVGGLKIIRLYLEKDIWFLMFGIISIGIYQYLWIDLNKLNDATDFFSHFPIFFISSLFTLIDWRKWKVIFEYQITIIVQVFLLIILGLFIPWVLVNILNIPVWEKNHLWQYSLIICFFVFKGLYKPDIITKFLENKYLVFLGKISFSWYLIHGFIGTIVTKSPFVTNYYLNNLMGIAISLLTAYVFYWYIEVPSIRRAKLFSSWIK